MWDDSVRCAFPIVKKSPNISLILSGHRNVIFTESFIFKMEKNVDRHGPRSLLAEPPGFFLSHTTFN
jgi:hypothetical protein